MVEENGQLNHPGHIKIDATRVQSINVGSRFEDNRPDGESGQSLAQSLAVRTQRMLEQKAKPRTIANLLRRRSKQDSANDLRGGRQVSAAGSSAHLQHL